ncbi:PH domain-containing protein [Nocardia sp. CDC159]|uniref:PH domain-containing protein n=1 Tax=Nocardia pulmonis TaxID=2951408 RepID=A0A9X2E8Z7_9NOCA|nr:MULTISPECIES: PH domain-containing protein [Nocardia]MCM6775881.1 PH domain-containing protein [Nocardia pulmonis]MCM6788143.1 PH domain-containing protein [Nocardia sp. CDC159]
MAQPHSPGAAPGRTIMAAPAWRPSPRAKLLWAIGPAIGWAVLLLGELIWLLLDDRHRAIQFAVLAVSVVAAAFVVGVVPLWRYAVHRWEITDEAVYIRTGWLTQESRVAPITRVQTVDTQRGPLDRLLGLATVTVTTASSAGAVRITALDLPVAEQTVTRLTEVAAAHRGDAT